MQVASRISAMASSGAPAEPYWGLYFEAEQAGCVVNMNKYAATNTVNLECSRDGATWTDFDANHNTGTTPVTLANVGDRVYFRTKGSTVGNPFATGDYQYRYFTLSKKAGAHGNIMSLAKGDEATTRIPAANYFYALFDSCSNLTSAPDLPAISLKDNCYGSLFYDCSGLVSGPPILPSTTPFPGCYAYMFYGCSRLTAAPEIKGTEYAQYCYYKMFEGCSALSSITVAFTQFSSSNNQFTDWVKGVAASGTFTCPTALGTNSTIARGTSKCPTGWTVVNF